MDQITLDGFDGGTKTSWKQYDEQDLKEYYTSIIEPKLVNETSLKEGQRPTKRELLDIGAGDYVGALQRETDRTMKEFLEEVVGLEDRYADHEFRWNTTDEQTLDKLDEFMQHLRNVNQQIESENTYENIAYVLNPWLEGWFEIHDNEKLIETLKQANEEEMYDSLEPVFEYMDTRVPSGKTKRMYGHYVNEFCKFLNTPTQPLDYNPVSDLLSQYDWGQIPATPENRLGLTIQAITKLWNAANSSEEHFLLIAAFAWGLRTNEIASLHVSQLTFAPDYGDHEGPVIEFESRKWGSNPVNVVYGISAAKNHIEHLQSIYGDEWSGYLFPSADSNRDYIRRKNLREQFGNLGDQAGLDLGEVNLSPKHGRNTWYQLWWEGNIIMHQLEEKVSTPTNGRIEDMKRDLAEVERLNFERFWFMSKMARVFGSDEFRHQRNRFEDIELLSSLVSRFREMFADKEDMGFRIAFPDRVEVSYND